MVGRRWSRKKLAAAVTVLVLLLAVLVKVGTTINPNPKLRIGQQVDSLHGVAVYYNGGVGHNGGRSLAKDGYNLGIKSQCVEFVKRYYYEHLGHRMPDSYGHAKDFFDKRVPEGGVNARRGLVQYRNPSTTVPCECDLLVFGPTLLNRFGHVAIVSRVDTNSVEIVQQNPGPFGSSRRTIPLVHDDHAGWKVGERRVLGWLRKEAAEGR